MPPTSSPTPTPSATGGTPWSSLTSDFQYWLENNTSPVGMQGAGNASQWNALSPSQESELANAYYSSGDIFNIFGNAQEFTGVGNASTSGGPIGMASTGLGTSAQAAKGVVGQGVGAIITQVFQYIGGFLVGFVTGAISEVRASFSRHLLALVVGLVVVVVLFH